MTSRSKLETEFGAYTEWLVEAIKGLGPGDRIPAACRGTGRPALFEQMADHLAISESSRVLDVGAGLGGPAAWLARERGCRVIAVDMIEAQVRASRALFPELSAVTGAAERLPVRDGSQDAVWALGVLEMVPEKQRAVAELVRVLRGRGRVVIYGFFSERERMVHTPSANAFGSIQDLVQDLETGGARVIHSAPAEAAAAPDSWRHATARVRSEVKRTHEGDVRLTLAETQLGSFNWLRMTGAIRDWIVVGEKESVS